MNPRDIVVNRFMAELAETDQLSSTLSWRKRVVELNPHSTGDRLALAAVAVRMRDLTSATDALAGINAADRNTAAYHNMAGSLDAAASQLAAAEVHLLEAIRLEPHNSAWQLSLAVLRLHDTDRRRDGRSAEHSHSSGFQFHQCNSTLPGSTRTDH